MTVNHDHEVRVVPGGTYPWLKSPEWDETTLYYDSQTSHPPHGGPPFGGKLVFEYNVVSGCGAF